MMRSANRLPFDDWIRLVGSGTILIDYIEISVTRVGILADADDLALCSNSLAFQACFQCAIIDRPAHKPCADNQRQREKPYQDRIRGTNRHCGTLSAKYLLKIET